MKKVQAENTGDELHTYIFPNGACSLVQALEQTNFVFVISRFPAKMLEISQIQVNCLEKMFLFRLLRRHLKIQCI